MFKSKEQFGKALEVLSKMLLERGNDGVNEREYRGFVHIATACMMDSFVCGESGSGVPELIEKMETANNPLATAIASAMRWSYKQGTMARG